MEIARRKKGRRMVSSAKRCGESEDWRERMQRIRDLQVAESGIDMTAILLYNTKEEAFGFMLAIL